MTLGITLTGEHVILTGEDFDRLNGQVRDLQRQVADLEAAKAPPKLSHDCTHTYVLNCEVDIMEWKKLGAEDIPALVAMVKDLQRQVAELQQDLTDARNGWEAGGEEICKLDKTIAEQRRTIEALMMGVEEHIGKEGTTPVLRYIAELEDEVQRLIELNKEPR